MATGDNGFNGFVNIRLESQDKKAIKALAENTTGEDVWGFILETVSEGYAISISPDFENDAVIVTLTGRSADEVNYGFAMSQRHSDPLVAVCAARFAHEEIAQRQDWNRRAYDWREVDW